MQYQQASSALGWHKVYVQCGALIALSIPAPNSNTTPTLTLKNDSTVEGCVTPLSVKPYPFAILSITPSFPIWPVRQTRMYTLLSSEGTDYNWLTYS